MIYVNWSKSLWHGKGEKQKEVQYFLPSSDQMTCPLVWGSESCAWQSHSSHTELELISSTLESVRNDALQHASGLAERTEETEKTGQTSGLRHTFSTASLRGHCHVLLPCIPMTFRYPCSGGDGKELWIIFKSHVLCTVAESQSTESEKQYLVVVNLFLWMKVGEWMERNFMNIITKAVFK